MSLDEFSRRKGKGRFATVLSDERQDLAEILNCSPSLSIAYELKEELRQIYESNLTVKGGLRAIKKCQLCSKPSH